MIRVIYLKTFWNTDYSGSSGIWFKQLRLNFRAKKVFTFLNTKRRVMKAWKSERISINWPILLYHMSVLYKLIIEWSDICEEGELRARILRLAADQEELRRHAAADRLRTARRSSSSASTSRYYYLHCLSPSNHWRWLRRCHMYPT